MKNIDANTQWLDQDLGKAVWCVEHSAIVFGACGSELALRQKTLANRATAGDQRSLDFFKRGQF